MRERLLFTAALFIYLMINDVHAQSLRYPVALPYVTLSAYSARQADAFSFTGNQGALAQIKQGSAGIYAERRFLLAELAAYSGAVAIPTRSGNFGVALNYSGFSNFNEHKLGLAYAKSLGKRLDIGIQFNYYSYKVPAYANASAINFEAGAIMHFTEKFTGGIQFYNPVGGKFGKTGEEKLASAYKFGFGYDASDNFFVSGEIVKEEDKPVNVVAGMQYHFAKRFFARGGFLSESATAYAGFGLGWNDLRLDISVSHHPQLGFSPGILLVSSFGKRKY